MSLVDSSRLVLVPLEKVVHSLTLRRTVGFGFLPRTLKSVSDPRL